MLPCVVIKPRKVYILQVSDLKNLVQIGVKDHMRKRAQAQKSRSPKDTKDQGQIRHQVQIERDQKLIKEKSIKAKETKNKAKVAKDAETKDKKEREKRKRDKRPKTKR